MKSTLIEKGPMPTRFYGKRHGLKRRQRPGETVIPNLTVEHAKGAAHHVRSRGSSTGMRQTGMRQDDLSSDLQNGLLRHIAFHGCRNVLLPKRSSVLSCWGLAPGLGRRHSTEPNGIKVNGTARHHEQVPSHVKVTTSMVVQQKDRSHAIGDAAGQDPTENIQVVEETWCDKDGEPTQGEIDPK